MTKIQPLTFDDREDEPWYGALEFRTLAETVPAMLFVSTPSGHVVYTNSAYQRFTGVASQQLLGIGCLDFLHVDDRKRAEKVFSCVVELSQPYEIELRIRRHDGCFRWHQVRGAPVLDKSGEVLRWIGVCTDIQDLHTAVASAQDTHKLLAVVGKSTDAIVFAKDAQGRFVFANDATLQVLESTADQVIGTSVDAMAGNTSEASSIDENDARVLASGEMIVFEEKWTTREGVERTYRSTKGPWQRADGTIGIVGITTDITRERELADKVKNQDHAYHTLAESLPLPLWVSDATGAVIVRNNLWQSYTGLTDSLSSPITFSDLVDPRDYKDFIDEWQSCIEHQCIFQTTVRLRDAVSNKPVLHRVVAVPVLDAQGAFSGWVGSAVTMA
jgi:PAS domain S-box-containing protein